MGLSWGAPLIVHGDALSVSIADLCIHIHSQNQHSMRVITHDVPSWELHSHAVLVLADANLINDSSSGACNMLLPPNNYACKAWKKLPTTRHPWCLMMVHTSDVHYWPFGSIIDHQKYVPSLRHHVPTCTWYHEQSTWWYVDVTSHDVNMIAFGYHYDIMKCSIIISSCQRLPKQTRSQHDIQRISCCAHLIASKYG